MGTHSSKPQNQREETKEEIKSTKSPSDSDPRSPTIDINRTPLQQLGTPKTSRITKNVDLSKECFDKYEQGNALNPAIRSIMNTVDPRSPTIDFERTPLAFILKNPQIVGAAPVIKFNGLDESQVSVNGDPDQSTPAISVPEKLEEADRQEGLNSEALVESKVAESVSEECKVKIEEMKSPVGLLETNLDYLETDLDTVRRKTKKLLKQVPSVAKSEVASTESGDPKVLNFSCNDPRSPSTDIDRTPILRVETKREKESSKPQYAQSTKMQEHMKDLFKYNLELQQKRTLEMPNDTEGNENLTDSLLIYDDELPASNVIPKKQSAALGERSRTPLACVVNIENNSKLTPEYILNTNSKVNSGNVKNSKSRIPVKVHKITPPQNDVAELKGNALFVKEKNLKSRRLITTNCENTPPKGRKACWDHGNNSVVL